MFHWTDERDQKLHDHIKRLIGEEGFGLRAAFAAVAADAALVAPDLSESVVRNRFYSGQIDTTDIPRQPGGPKGSYTWSEADSDLLWERTQQLLAEGLSVLAAHTRLIAEEPAFRARTTKSLDTRFRRIEAERLNAAHEANAAKKEAAPTAEPAEATTDTAPPDGPAHRPDTAASNGHIEPTGPGPGSRRTAIRGVTPGDPAASRMKVSAAEMAGLEYDWEVLEAFEQLPELIRDWSDRVARLEERVSGEGPFDFFKFAQVIGETAELLQVAKEGRAIVASLRAQVEDLRGTLGERDRNLAAIRKENEEAQSWFKTFMESSSISQMMAMGDLKERMRATLDQQGQVLRLELYTERNGERVEAPQRRSGDREGI